MLLLAALLAAMFVVAGCGDDDDDSSASDEPAAAAETTADTGSGEDSNGEDGEAGEGSGDSGNGDSGSEGEGGDDAGDSEPAPDVPENLGDGSIQGFGEEASAEDRGAAAAAAEGYLRARAASQWGRACSFMANGIQEQLQQFASQAGKQKNPNCGQALGSLTAGLPKEVREQAAQVQIASLRIEGEQGFAIYRSGKMWMFMPVAEEDGDWKVAAIAGSQLR